MKNTADPDPIGCDPRSRRCDPWSHPYSGLWSLIPYTSLRPWHMIGTIPAFAAIAEKKSSDCCDNMDNISATVATTITEIDVSSISAIVATHRRLLWSYGNHSFELFSDRGDRSDPCDVKFTRVHCVQYPLQDGTNIVAYFMEEEQQYDCLYDRFSGDYKNKYMNVNCWTANGEKFDMSACQNCDDKKFKHRHALRARPMLKC